LITRDIKTNIGNRTNNAKIATIVSNIDFNYKLPFQILLKKLKPILFYIP